LTPGFQATYLQFPQVACIGNLHYEDTTWQH
jgi:hypothetical protein